MSGNSDSERKYLPPSAHKLRRARERAQIMGSEHFVSAATFLAGIMALLLVWKKIVREFAAMLEAGSRPVENTEPTELVLAMFQSVFYILFNMAIFFGVVAVAAIIANIVHKGGVFSADPVSPKFERVSLASGFKRVFGLKSWVELGVGFLRMFIWLFISAIVIYYAYSFASRSTLCGLTCQFNLSVQMVLLLIGIAILILIIIGVTDLPLQQFLFLHEMKMGKSESKRDQKESIGDPKMKTARKDLGKSMIDAAVASSGGMSVATFLITGQGVAIALRYDSEKYPVPVVIAKGVGENSARLVQSAQVLNVPIVDENVLASTLYKDVLLGSAIAKKHFDLVAMALVKSRI